MVYDNDIVKVTTFGKIIFIVPSVAQSEELHLHQVNFSNCSTAMLPST
jgi:hypothetical protein